MKEKTYFDKSYNDREKMVYYFEKYKEALKCKKETEANEFLHLAHQYLKTSQIIKENNAE